MDKIEIYHYLKRQNIAYEITEHKATVPAVIVECGFISNEEEAKNLSNEEYQSKIAFAIYCGILEYKNKN